MRRPTVLLTLVIGAALSSSLAAGALGLVGCGGNDKPPLTPDMVDPGPDGADAAVTPTMPSTQSSPR